MHTNEYKLESKKNMPNSFKMEFLLHGYAIFFSFFVCLNVENDAKSNIVIYYFIYSSIDT